MLVASTRQLYVDLKGLMAAIGKGEYAVITHRGKPAAVLMPIDEDHYAEFIKEHAPPFVRFVAKDGKPE